MWTWAGRRLLSTATATAQKQPLVEKVLIANRGEIACRVMRTCERLGVQTVAVYSEADANSMHVQMADEAFCVGPAPSNESYLRMDKIVEIAKQSGAQAIHPGYGFLSENADFADLVAKSGLKFIGPPSSAIIAMGSKSASKQIMQEAGVPVVPGYHGDNQDPQFLKQQADKIGYPVLIKAIKGGGGKGMRIVEKAEDFEMMLESSKRESIKSFGDDRVLVEKYLTTPRHVEVQVFCDTLGNAVYLFERDCSVQRRHQKIIEEAPAPLLSDELRHALGTKAVAAAKAVNYVGAGTVEFIMDNTDKQFYFMEMNTRLQVEHPVTEMITGTDLVEWQLEVASGNRLPKLQPDLSINGHCFEARIYAENPKNNFLPDTGLLTHLRTPTPSSTIRVETGVRPGDEVSVYYDPMIAKLVVWGPDRLTALRRLRKALNDYEVVGPYTNIEFLKTLSSHHGFIAADVETGFIKRFEKELFPPAQLPPADVPMQAVVALILREASAALLGAASTVSPWASLVGNRLNHKLERQFEFYVGEDASTEASRVIVDCLYDSSSKSFDLKVKQPSGEVIEYQGVKAKAINNEHADSIQCVIRTHDQTLTSNIVIDEDQLHIFSNGNRTTLTRPNILKDLREQALGHHGTTSSVKAPMPCKIAQVMVKPGQNVKKGTPLVILEAMKMEHVIRAPMDATIERVSFQAGELAGENQILVVFQDDDKAEK